MKTQKMLGIEVLPKTQKDILEEIILFIDNPRDFFHIVSLNVENIVVAHEREDFRQVLDQAQIKLIDGIGILLGGSILNIGMGERFPGVDLMSSLLKQSEKMSLRVLFLGGSQKSAEQLAECYQQNQAQSINKSQFQGIEGIKNISHPTSIEEEKIFSIVADYMPQIIFVAFGSPHQELWLWRHREKFKGIVCMGVGGGFDFLTGKVRRAPIFIRSIGLEWLFRLLLQPWRWKRQLRIFKFISLVFKEKIHKKG